MRFEFFNELQQDKKGKEIFDDDIAPITLFKDGHQ